MSSRRSRDARYDNIVEKGFDRGDENDADEKGVRLANKVGYTPGGLGDVPDEARGAQQGQRRSATACSRRIPTTQDRIDSLDKQIKAEKLAATAMVDGALRATITFDAKPLAEIATVVAGPKGWPAATRQERRRRRRTDDKKGGAEEEGIRASGWAVLSKGKQAEIDAGVGVGRRRGGGMPDRDAKGGGNPNKVVRDDHAGGNRRPSRRASHSASEAAADSCLTTSGT